MNGEEEEEAATGLLQVGAIIVEIVFVREVVVWECAPYTSVAAFCCLLLLWRVDEGS